MVKEEDSKILKEFTIWVAAKYGMPFSEKLIEAEIDAFFKYRASLNEKLKGKKTVTKSKKKGDEWSYHD